MDTRDNIFEQIEAYLADELTAEERASFEEQMKTDANLAEEVSLQRDTHHLVGLYADQIAYKEKLRVIDQKMNAEGTKTIPLFKRLMQSPVYRMAAVALVLVASAWVLLLFQKNSAQLGRDAFTPYADVITYKGDAQSADSLIHQGMTSYNLKNYPAARASFEKLLQIYPDYPDAQFYMAMSLMAEKSYPEAIPYLENLLDAAKYGEVAQWYLSLAYLSSDQEDKAREVLAVIISEPAHGYTDKARQLLDKMDAPWWKF